MSESGQHDLDVKEKQEKPSRPQEMLATLTDRFEKGEMPTTTAELLAKANEFITEGSELGFRGAESYVGMSGELIIVTYKQRGADWNSEPRECRVLVDGIIREVVIPVELRGQSLMFRNGVGSDGIYDVKGKGDVSEELQPLVDAFGEKLDLESDGEVDYIEGLGIGLATLNARLEHQRSVIAAAEQEAYRIEMDGRLAAGLAKGGLFGIGLRACPRSPFRPQNRHFRLQNCHLF